METGLVFVEKIFPREIKFIDSFSEKNESDYEKKCVDEIINIKDVCAAENMNDLSDKQFRNTEENAKQFKSAEKNVTFEMDRATMNCFQTPSLRILPSSFRMELKKSKSCDDLPVVKNNIKKIKIVEKITEEEKINEKMVYEDIAEVKQNVANFHADETCEVVKKYDFSLNDVVKDHPKITGNGDLHNKISCSVDIKTLTSLNAEEKITNLVEEFKSNHIPSIPKSYDDTNKLKNIKMPQIIKIHDSDGKILNTEKLDSTFYPKYERIYSKPATDVEGFDGIRMQRIIDEPTSYWSFQISMCYDKKLYCFSHPFNWVRIMGEINVVENKHKVLSRKFPIINFSIKTPILFKDRGFHRPNYENFPSYMSQHQTAVVSNSDINTNTTEQKANEKIEEHKIFSETTCEDNSNKKKITENEKFIDDNGHKTNFNVDKNNNHVENCNFDQKMKCNSINTNVDGDVNNKGNIHVRVPNSEPYHRLWLCMADSFCHKSFDNGSDNFTLILFILPNPSYTYFNGRTSRNGWTFATVVVPSLKYGVHNTSHYVQDIYFPSMKRKLNKYSIPPQSWKCFHFQILWESHTKKRFAAWNVILEFIDPFEKKIFTNGQVGWEAKMLFSSHRFHFSNELNGNFFIPRPKFVKESIKDAMDDFVTVQDIILPAAAPLNQENIKIPSVGYTIKLPVSKMMVR
ncbi:hypothetical protein HELRODRAFT_190310 [Helobdella robusta]|uniref:Uncharacterized protein n=1 Tax=Helobdella robusta TaxID=6412 RepID=T1FRW2_HELRO|nr:hypothetical protein HELRODRAFT_190310 [Helobdella robusta]ESO09867.1 hypothetical protein HELRODRAFT_190310 [Helobdella robusta]